MSTQGDAYENAVLLLPGWRHTVTRRLHIRRDCRAVMYHAANMTPVLVRFDYENDRELRRLLAPDDMHEPCKYCFPGSG
jgi:hypothetical protein